MKGERDILLIPCSLTKDSGSNSVHPRSGGLAARISDTQLGEALLSARARIKGLIESGKLIGGEFREGNRVARSQNRQLFLGPDLGGTLNGKRYLPAYKRYTGRAYQSTPQEWAEFFARDESERPDILVVSGLYGMLEIDEHVQNYDCHFTDVDSTTGKPINQYWKEILTRVLASRIEFLEAQGYRVNRIFEILAEDIYRVAFDWDAIHKRWTVWHQVFERSANRDSLDNVGFWLRGVVTNPDSLRNLQADTFYENPEFLASDRVKFVPHGAGPVPQAEDTPSIAQANNQSNAVRLFVSYARKDLRIFENLRAHLRTMEREGIIETWHDLQLELGREWQTEIERRLRNADLILFLLSRNFIDSEYCDLETKLAWEQHRAGKARLIPLIVSPVDWKSTSFSKLPILPRNGEPIGRRDAAMRDVAIELRHVVQKMRAGAEPVSSLE